MAAYSYYKRLITLQSIFLVCCIGSALSGKISIAIIFGILHLATIASKINILLEKYLEADPDFWE